MIVELKNAREKRKKVNLNFSFMYFVLGPLYFLFKKAYIRFLLLFFLYVVFLWVNFLPIIYGFLDNFAPLPKMAEDIANFPKENIPYTYVFIGVVHFLISLRAQRFAVKKALNNEYHPNQVLDSQKLIRHRLAKVGIKSYEEVFNPKKGVGAKVKIRDNKEVRKELDQLGKLLKSGMLTKDEYNQKRAEIIMGKKK